ncbi:MAG: hypothetical protein PHY45_07975 [Rhodocyclaceae bacterium]|nr:hypothetical protein [Rhodocyclaceae bacterium]
MRNDRRDLQSLTVRRGRHAVVLAFLLAGPLLSALADAVPDADMQRVMAEDRVDSAHLERALQGLSWEQFRAVIEAIPKLKADVEAYGPAGWEYVKRRYKTYAWRKNIDKLDSDEKKKLAALIESAAGTR